MNKLYIIGIGFKPLESRAKEILKKVPYIVIFPKLLPVFKNYDVYSLVKDKVVSIKNYHDMLAFVEENIKHNEIACLSSGDPFYFGIGEIFLKKFGEKYIEIYPDISCLQKGLSLIKKPWYNIKTISLHGRSLNILHLINLLFRENRICLLTDPQNNPSLIAQLLIKEFPHPEKLTFYIFERLGYNDERIIVESAFFVATNVFKNPNFVIIDYKNTENMIILGLEESEIAHSQGMITKDEIRAIVIHKLKLPAKGVIWDIGAGSGSISIEIARLNPSLKVFAIEKDDIYFLTKNKHTYFTDNLEIIKGVAPECLKTLPYPDRVFIGGSKGKLKDILNFISGIPSVKIVVLTAITLETLDIASKVLKSFCKNLEICQININQLKNIKNMQIFTSKNPVFIIKGVK